MRRSRAILLFTVAVAGAGSGVFFSVINSYLIDIYGVGAEGRGLLEFFRELPGVLAVLFLGVAAFLKEKYLMAAAAVLISASFVGMSSMPSHYAVAVMFIFFWSVGAHINLTLHSSYSVALSDSHNHGRLFGAVGGARGLGRVVGAGIVWLGMGSFGMNYMHVLWVAAAFAITAALGYLTLDPVRHTSKKRRRFVLRKRYKLFYMMAVLFGFRKQIFLVFAPWLLIKVFGKQASDIGMLMMISAFVGIFARPMLGRLIDIIVKTRRTKFVHLAASCCTRRNHPR